MNQNGGVNCEFRAANLFGPVPMCLIAWVMIAKIAGADPLPLTDNQKPPYLAVWKEPKYQPGGMNEYNAWLNRKLVWADLSPCLFYTLPKTWAEVEMPFDKVWGAWMAEVPGRRAVMMISMLPTDGSKLATGATGAYNGHFTELAKNLVANHMGNAILWMSPTNSFGQAWKVSNKDDAANFDLYWQQIVTTMRAVPGAEKLQFDWVAPNGKIGYQVEEAYPGDKDVDMIGCLLEEGSGNRKIYPYPAFASESERLYRQKMAWDQGELPLLQKWSAFAKAHGKPFSIPQWHLSADHTRSEGFDAPLFIESVFNYIQDPANNVYFASYFEYYHYSWLSATSGYKTNEPKAAEAFHRLFALPATAAH